jgi:hypothetical protein
MDQTYRIAEIRLTVQHVPGCHVARFFLVDDSCPPRLQSHMGGGGRSVLVGRITALGPAFMTVGVVRVELPEGQSTSDFHLGDAVTVMAVSLGDEMFVAEKVVLHNHGALSGESPFL